ncbi:Por secretion system C-terminal sorting domain-containing protein [Flexibacter flexilis DSM 6793]|uniref:Por secretion system C-terminal sorting domain-containing protein n=1 Tax=Flexibacter flexilis DSM 6793 TaxID=927664 RepID=A0A1I1L664_9BACT|nr:T9SS type A sorting domain-containing protein [Flexibacter flexilis]SFC68501.1 Por secretion system C-terminal sorting domain-containing protein [Flexibacter flexilis DSM 6793]
MRTKISLLSLLAVCGGLLSAKAQINDTITVMQYNLTNYGNYTSYCTTTNNAVATKDPNIKTIVKYVNPDIVGFNEVNKTSTYADRLRDLVLNTDGVTHYQKTPSSNTVNSSIINMLYYNSDKLVYHSRETILAATRDIDLYRLYYKDPNLAVTNDTVFFVCIVAHLKAGNTTADATTRGQMTQSVVDFLAAKNKAANYMFMGDLNLYTSAETAYQNLITPTNSKYKFYDPINKMGAWSGNSSFKAYHTQSTRVTSNGCLAGGGMDDRFDHIMLTSHLLNDSAGAQFIQGSYKAVGQDGNRYNGNVNDGTNSSVPAAVANALFNSSDHLPVTAKFKVTGTVTSLLSRQNQQLFVRLANPVRNGLIRCEIKDIDGTSYKLSIYNTVGQLLNSTTAQVESGQLQTSIQLPQGLYMLRVENTKGLGNTQRMLIE